jgi:hypothetical protein
MTMVAGRALGNHYTGIDSIFGPSRGTYLDNLIYLDLADLAVYYASPTNDYCSNGWRYIRFLIL